MQLPHSTFPLRCLQRRTRPPIEALEQRIAPATFIVTTTADSGPGSLRNAITQANATTATDEIVFAITGVEGGVVTIEPSTPLPQIIAAVNIHGFTEPGAAANTAPSGQPTNAEFRVVLDGSLLADGAAGLDLAAVATVEGLVLDHFGNSAQAAGAAIKVSAGGSNSAIHDNFIGTDSTGANAAGNSIGVLIGSGASGVQVQANLISGNFDSGVKITDATTKGNTVSGNFIGTDRTGTVALGNATGVLVALGAHGNDIVANTIAGNGIVGVWLRDAGTSGNTVRQNSIGIGADGAALGDGAAGVAISGGAAANVIGGADADGNQIGYHPAPAIVAFLRPGLIPLGAPTFPLDIIADSGVSITGGSTTGNVVGGNSIFGNDTGVSIWNAPGNTVGETETAAGNLIYDNSVAGIHIALAKAADNVVSGNTIGFLFDGEAGYAAHPNGIGVWVEQAPGAAVTGNAISGNTTDGIHIEQEDQTYSLGSPDYFSDPVVTQPQFTTAQTDEGAPFTTLFTSGQTITLQFDGPFVDGNASFSTSLWNLNTRLAGKQVASISFDGVTQDVSSFEANPVGPGMVQYYSANVDPSWLADGHLTVAIKLGTLPAGVKVGIDYGQLYVARPTNVVVTGNSIGTSAARGLDFGNGDDGIETNQAQDVQIGDGTPAGANVVVGNTGAGVHVFGGGAPQIRGNFIGLDPATGRASANGEGVWLDYAYGATIGGTEAGDGNVISGNKTHGVIISGGNSNTLDQNFIGTNAAGTAAVPNGGSGVALSAYAGYNTIGDFTGNRSNLISGNNGPGVSIDSTSYQNSLAGNYLGLDAAGTSALQNGEAGVQIGGRNNELRSNVISGQSYGPGVLITGASAQFNVLTGNEIGVDANGDSLPNLNGVVITDSASDNQIGDTNGNGNTIAYNSGNFGYRLLPHTVLSPTGDGVLVGTDSVRNSILGNSIHDNARYGIELAGGNDGQVAPLLGGAFAQAADASTTFKGGFTSTPSTTYRVELFLADAGNANLPDNEGKTYLDSFDVTTDSAGVAVFRHRFSEQLTLGTLVTATATALDAGTPGDTSQFAGAIPVTAGLNITDAAIVEGNSGTKQMTFTVSLSAPVDKLSTVAFNTADFSDDSRNATANVDYVSQDKGLLSFGVDDPLTKTISVTVNGDTVGEMRERFKVLLGDVTGSVGVDDGEGVGTIIDDDHHTIAVGSGNSSRVQIFDSVSGNLLQQFDAFPKSMPGGIHVAQGDVNGDGVDDVIVSEAGSGLGRVRVFDGANLSANAQPMLELRPFGAGYRGGVFVAAGDVNGDGHADLIASTAAGSTATVRVWDLSGAARFVSGPELLTSFKAFGKVNGGVRVAAGDFNGDGLADIAVTNGVGTEVRLFHGDGTPFEGALGKFNAYDKNTRGGLFVSAGDLDGDGRDDLITGLASGASTVRTFLTGTGSPILSHTFTPLGPVGGVRVAVADVNSDGIADIVAAPGVGGGSALHVFNGDTSTELLKIIALGGKATGGGFVG